METMTLPCREHGGQFEIPKRRGRPPVRCNEDHPCRKAGTSKRVRKAEPVEVPAPVRRAATKPTNGKAARDEAAVKAAVARNLKRRETEVVPEPLRTRAKAPQAAATASTTTNPSLPMAQAAKRQLEPLGWVVQGRAWVSDGAAQWAEIVATRDTETIIIRWMDGNLIEQNYMLWNHQKPSVNIKGMPPRKLDFDPDEASDRELVERLSGMKVTWWNRLGRSTESAVIPDKVNVEHTYNSRGDETPGERIIKFVDRNGTGFRAFYVAALIKIG